MVASYLEPLDILLLMAVGMPIDRRTALYIMEKEYPVELMTTYRIRKRYAKRYARAVRRVPEKRLDGRRLWGNRSFDNAAGLLVAQLYDVVYGIDLSDDSQELDVIDPAIVMVTINMRRFEDVVNQQQKPQEQPRTKCIDKFAGETIDYFRYLAENGHLLTPNGNGFLSETNFLGHTEMSVTSCGPRLQRSCWGTHHDDICICDGNVTIPKRGDWINFEAAAGAYADVVTNGGGGEEWYFKPQTLICYTDHIEMTPVQARFFGRLLNVVNVVSLSNRFEHIYALAAVLPNLREITFSGDVSRHQVDPTRFPPTVTNLLFENDMSGDEYDFYIRSADEHDEFLKVYQPSLSPSPSLPLSSASSESDSDRDRD